MKESFALVLMAKLMLLLHTQGLLVEKLKNTMSWYLSQAKVTLNTLFLDEESLMTFQEKFLSVIRGSKSEPTLRALVCDGTAVNTGKNNGVIRKIEPHLQRPLQW